MSYIQPNSSVIVLKGIPFENNYEHTILFDDEEEQHDYFYSKRHLVAGNSTLLTGNYSYQRVGSNKIRIGAAIEKLINCNYMMFKNISFENKWFYAFVTDIEYVNNNCTELTYELDVMQTWMFDYTLQECFVEREHSATDKPGDNTVPESLEVGEYVYKYIGTYNGNSSPTWDNDDYCVCILAPFEIHVTWTAGVPVVTTGVESESGFYNGNFSGLYYNTYYTNNTQHMLDLWAALKYMLQNKLEDIVAIYTLPAGIISQKQLLPVDSVHGQNVYIERENWVYGLSTVNNKKLYTYPYSLIHVLSSDNETHQYKYELFNLGQDDTGLQAGKCKFFVGGTMGSPPQMMLKPISYAEDYLNNDNQSAFGESMIIKNFPMGSWVSDAFKAWIAQFTTTVGPAAIMSAIEMPVAPTMATNTLANATLNSISALPKAIMEGAKSHGSSNNIIAKSAGFFGYSIYQAHIKPEYAAIIDDYFTKYGYATKRVKVPNIHSRPYWNYVETKDCNINQVTGLNSQDTAKISSIYDHGITFWHTSNVGDYTQNNAPVGGT